MRKPDSMRTQINKVKILKCLKHTFGNVRKACLESGVTKSTFYHWLKKDEQFRCAVLNVYKSCKELAIDVIVDKIGDDVDELFKICRRNHERSNIL